MIKRLLKKLKEHMLAERSADRLAFSCTLGIFFAFTPFIGVQTWIALACTWILHANIPIMLAVLYIVNNPWTMLPIYALDYLFGVWLFHTVLGFDLQQFNPSFMAWINEKVGPWLSSYIGVTELCFWCFLCGGIILGALIAAICHPVVKLLIKRWLSKQSKKQTHEDHNAE